MFRISGYPLLLFVLSLATMWLAARAGAAFGRRRRLETSEREDLGIVLSAVLTLLGLIIGFSFSMAVSRYDQRKNYEEAEANAIGTEYVRTDLLPAADGAKVRDLLKKYLDLRIQFYQGWLAHRVPNLDAATAQVQNELWSAIKDPSLAQPTPVMALVVSGMNDVLNSQGYTQAAWWNRIPRAAWILMVAIAVFCNSLVGYYAQREQSKLRVLFVLPLIVSISLFLIADIDSPKGGVIRVSPQNLEAVAQSLKTP